MNAVRTMRRGARRGTTRMSKATNKPLTLSYLKSREDNTKAGGWPTPKWIEFSKVMMANGLTVILYEARQTVSKYVTVTDGTRQFKVRFSNHKPIQEREAKGDCDFFVGRTHFGVTTTSQAIAAVAKFFNRIIEIPSNPPEVTTPAGD